MSLRQTGLLLAVLTMAAGLGAAGLRAQDAQGEITRRVKSKVEAVYPQLARKMNITGTVKVEIVVTPNGVTIIGATNLPGSVPTAASNAFSRNISALLLHMTADGALQIDTTDEIQAGVVITRDGEVVQPAVAKLLQESLHHEGASLVDRPGH